MSQRFNSFNLIHKALRALLYDTALMLQQTLFADTTEAEVALDRVKTVINTFQQHAHHEDTFMLPAAGAFVPRIVEEFEKEHEEDMELGNRLIHIINSFRSARLPRERNMCGADLTKAFTDFMMFNIGHMAKEEVKINPVLWDHYTDQELMALNARLAATIPAEEKIFNAKWMMRGINKAEAIAWLTAVKQTAPSFVFQQLLDLTETELPEAIRTEVQDTVMEDELVF
jgi:hypothetical protein